MALNSKDHKHVDSVTSREALHNAFTDTDFVLKNKVDKLMDRMKNIDIDFFNSYQQGRAVMELGVRHQKDEKPQPSPVGGAV